MAIFSSLSGLGGERLLGVRDATTGREMGLFYQLASDIRPEPAKPPAFLQNGVTRLPP
jgi:hypothetical protein